MKKILVILFLFAHFLLSADDIRPVGGQFKLLPTYSFSLNNNDSIPWMYGGKGRWFNLDTKSPWYAKMVINTDTVYVPVHKKDTLNLTIYKLNKDSIIASGYITNWRFKHKLDSVMALYYKKTQVDSLLNFKRNLNNHDSLSHLDERKYQSLTDTLTWGLGLSQSGHIVKVDTTSASILSRQRAVNTYIPLIQKGANNGVATLDAGGKVPLTQMNDGLLGAVRYQALYNATTNTPALPLASLSKGYYYIIDVGGTVGGIVYNPGDWIISSGLGWGKVDNNNAISSVFGRVGNITATSGDYTADQISETASRVFVSPTEKSNFNIAYGWGNHASAGYGLASALTTHAGLTTTAHGLGASAFHADSYFAPASGSGNYVQVSPASAQTGNIWMAGTGKFGGNLSFTDNTQILISDAIQQNGLSFNYGTDKKTILFDHNIIGLSLLNGAATFASTVSATQFIATGSGTNVGLDVKGGDGGSGTNIALFRDYGNSIVAGISGIGNISGRQLQSTVATGTAPLTVASTTMVSNLNAERWNGQLFYGGAFAVNPLYLLAYDGTGSRYSPMQPSAVATLLGTPTGTGTTNYIPKWTGSGTLGNSIVSENGTNVGVNGLGTARLGVRGFGATSSTYSFEAMNSGGATKFIVRDDGMSAFYGSDNGEKVRISETGNVGIGTTNPLYKTVISNSGAEGLEISPGWAAGDILIQAYNRSGGAYSGITFSASNYNFSNGNVGIGTTSPSNKLHVEGTGGGAAGIYLNSASPGTATYTLYNNGGNLYWNGNLLSTGSGSAITGGGTTNYLTKWTSASVLGDAQIYDNGTNVGIGTTSPAEKLTVNGYLGLQYGGTQKWHIGSDASGHLQVVESGISERLTILDGGSVGIGTTNPGAYKLYVNGDGFYNADVLANNYKLTYAGASIGGVARFVGDAVRGGVKLQSSSDGAGTMVDGLILNNYNDVIIPSLTASKLVFTGASKNLTSTGIGTSSQFIKGDGSLDGTTYLTSSSLSGYATQTWVGQQGYLTGTPWVNTHALNDHSNVSVAGATTGQVLTINSGGTWVAATPSSGMTYPAANYIATSVTGTSWANSLTWSTTSAGYSLVQRDASGNVSLTGSFCSSDTTLKRNIKPFSQRDFENIAKIDFRKFSFKADTTNQIHFGVAAQEVLKFTPEVVRINNETGKYEVNYTELLIQVVAQQKDAIENLTKRVEELEEKHNGLTKLLKDEN